MRFNHIFWKGNFWKIDIFGYENLKFLLNSYKIFNIISKISFIFHPKFLNFKKFLIGKHGFKFYKKILKDLPCFGNHSIFV